MTFSSSVSCNFGSHMSQRICNGFISIQTNLCQLCRHGGHVSVWGEEDSAERNATESSEMDNLFPFSVLFCWLLVSSTANKTFGKILHSALNVLVKSISKRLAGFHLCWVRPLTHKQQLNTQRFSVVEPRRSIPISSPWVFSSSVNLRIDRLNSHECVRLFMPDWSVCRLFQCTCECMCAALHSALNGTGSWRWWTHHFVHLHVFLQTSRETLTLVLPYISVPAVSVMITFWW